MKNEEFAKKKEKEGYLLLEDFNNDYMKLIELGQTPPKHTSDASGFTRDGRLLNFEIKVRNQTLVNNNTISGCSTDGKTYITNTIYIESHKCGDLLLDYIVEDKKPVYINFLNDGYVVMFNLSRLKHRPEKVSKRIYSKLYQGFELSKREELRLEDAWIYKKENNSYKLVRKPNVE